MESLAIFRDNWERACYKLNTPRGYALAPWIMGAYSDETRRYHNIDHIADCLMRLKGLVLLDCNREEVIASLCLHDVIYDVRSKQNEANSALLGFAIFNNHAIAANILATAGAARGAEKTWTEGEKLTHDVDRASLGGLYGEFLLTQKLIREEYRGVYTEEQWIAGRRSFLQSLLANRPIFKSSAGQYLWEKDAVSNIEAALAAIADQ